MPNQQEMFDSWPHFLINSDFALQPQNRKRS